uniref:Uncharacterized protein n=1 Tax=Rhizophora mucronata TaxID=61149 RepID=A0A2P2KT38_RHIMU
MLLIMLIFSGTPAAKTLVSHSAPQIRMIPNKSNRLNSPLTSIFYSSILDGGGFFPFSFWGGWWPGGREYLGCCGNVPSLCYVSWGSRCMEAAVMAWAMREL